MTKKMWQKKGGGLNEFIITRCIAHPTHAFADCISNQISSNILSFSRIVWSDFFYNGTRVRVSGILYWFLFSTKVQAKISRQIKEEQAHFLFVFWIKKKKAYHLACLACTSKVGGLILNSTLCVCSVDDLYVLPGFPQDTYLVVCVCVCVLPCACNNLAPNMQSPPPCALSPLL